MRSVRRAREDRGTDSDRGNRRPYRPQQMAEGVLLAALGTLIGITIATLRWACCAQSRHLSFCAQTKFA